MQINSMILYLKFDLTLISKVNFKLTKCWKLILSDKIRTWVLPGIKIGRFLHVEKPWIMEIHHECLKCHSKGLYTSYIYGTSTTWDLSITTTTLDKNRKQYMAPVWHFFSILWFIISVLNQNNLVKPLIVRHKEILQKKSCMFSQTKLW